MSKGFCFVEFDCQSAATKACELFNNCVPEEFTNSESKNYINIQGSLKQFNVISKKEWSLKKEQALKIKREIARLNPEKMYPVKDDYDNFNFAEGMLLRMDLRTSDSQAKKVMNKTI